MKPFHLYSFLTGTFCIQNMFKRNAICAGVFVVAMGTPSVFAQCNSNGAGNFTDTEFNTGANGSSTGGVDDNGGWNESAPYPFLEAGARIPGESFRVKGVVGTYLNSSGFRSRDMDWIRFSVPEGCSISVTLSMSDRNGIPVNGNTLYSLFFIEQGSDPDTAVDLYGAYGGCPHQIKLQSAGGFYTDQIPVAAGDVLIIVTTPFDSPAPLPPVYNGPMSYGLDVTVHSYQTCIGDLDGSGEIDSADVAEVLLSMGCSAWCEAPDVDFSGVVDSGDLAIVLLNIGCKANN